MLAVLVQVTTCPAAPQVQPAPAADTKPRPVARVSFTVVVPVTVVPPVLFTVSVNALFAPAVKSPECDFTTFSALGATVKLAARLWVIVFSAPSEPVTVAVQSPKLGLAGIV